MISRGLLNQQVPPTFPKILDVGRGTGKELGNSAIAHAIAPQPAKLMDVQLALGVWCFSEGSAFSCHEKEAM